MNGAPWNMEFCTVCDKQCPAGGVYCSERCRMVEVRKHNKVETSEPLSLSHSDGSEIESQESADEDSEVPSMWLPGSLKTAATAVRKQGHAKKETQFLYASPTLKPVKPVEGSPEMSPLLIPQSKINHDHFVMSQSVNTYRRWLADSA